MGVAKARATHEQNTTDLGTALVYGAALVAVLFFVGVRWLQLLVFLVAVVFAVIIGMWRGWLPLPDGQRTRIGRTGASRTLGSDAVLGARWHDPQAAIGIRSGQCPLVELLGRLRHDVVRPASRADANGGAGDLPRHSAADFGAPPRAGSGTPARRRG